MERENKFKNICEFYGLTHKLKNLLRTGWVKWGVKSNRIESVAEHIYGVQMLALAVNSEFELELDMQKLCLMLAIHELGEVLVGDLTDFDGISKEEKHKKEENAVIEILSNLKDKGHIKKIFDEYQDAKTKEAVFAHLVDKIECELQCKYYEEMGCNDFNTQRSGELEKVRQERIKLGAKNLTEAWISYDKEHHNYQGLYEQLGNYILENEIFKR